MRTNLTNFATPQFRVLSDDQIEQVFLAALELLEGVGTQVLDEASRKLLADGGAKVSGDRVRLGAGLVQQALATVPRRIVVGDRDGRRNLALESHRIYYGTGSDCPFIQDAQTGQRRKFLRHDIEDAARVVDACPNLDFHMSLGLMSDCPTYTYDRHQAAAMLRNTVKPLTLTAMSRQGLLDILEMYYLVRGGRDAFETNPGFIIYLEPVTPLVHGKAVLEKLRLSAERMIPAIYTPCPIAGGTAPATLAGVMTLSVAEFLVGAVISQATKAGAPLIMGGVLSTLDMRHSILTYGSPELHLMSAALTDVAHWMKIPVFSTAGCSDSKTLDEQAAVEAAMSILAAGLSGANLIHDVGFLESALLGSHEMVVLSDEIIGMAKRFLSGIRVDEETLAVDVIREVGPGGEFLMHAHTAKNFRKEFWFPRLISRERYDAWRAGGSKTLGDRVRLRVADVLAKHKVPPLPTDVDAGIDQILARADKAARPEEAQLA
jgi:trimethylamine--corrinoid protein Co-methyltransferase